MSVTRYALGIAALACLGGSLGAAAIALRARWLPDADGAPARLAESVIGLALLMFELELLGTLGLFRLGPIVVSSVLLGGVIHRVAGRPERAGTDARNPASATGERPLIRAVAFTAAGLVLAEWVVPTLHSYDVGIRAFDSLWYHLPWAAAFAQTGHVTPLHFTDVEYLTAFYPAGAELLHGLGIVLMGSDVLSPGLNLSLLGLTLLAAWCIGRPRGLQALTVTGAAVALGTPMLRFSQAGSAANDVVGVFFLLAAVALLVNATETLAAARTRTRAPVLVAAVAAGLAVAVKLSLLAPVLALSVGLVAIAPRGRRRTLGGAWAAGVAVAGGFWYLRNLVAVGNPLPWISFGALATPAAPLQQHTAFSVLHYVGNGQVWSRFLEPGLSSGLGPWWPLILGAAILGPLACVVRGSDRTTRVLGLVALASWLAYTVTPESAAGPSGHPAGFAFNLRYAAPALTLALAVGPLALAGAGRRTRLTTVVALALVLIVTLVQDRLWPGGYTAPGLLVGAVAIAAALLAASASGRAPRLRARSAALAGILALAGAGAALGYAGERHYLRGRYVYEPHVSSLARVWEWFRGVHHASVGLVGTFGGFFAYPLFGLDDSDRVTYVGHRGAHGSFTAIGSCPEWRRTLNAGGYRFVVTTPGRDPWRPARLLSSPEGTWTGTDPAAVRVFTNRAGGQPISVYELRGRLDPATCPPARR